MRKVIKKVYYRPVVEIIPFDTQCFMEGSATTEDFNKDDFDWDSDSGVSTGNEDFQKDDFVWDTW